MEILIQGKQLDSGVQCCAQLIKVSMSFLSSPIIGTFDNSIEDGAARVISSTIEIPPFRSLTPRGPDTIASEEGVLKMTNLGGVVQLLKKEHARLTSQIEGVSAALAAFGATYKNGAGTRRMSAAGRARIAAAQRARWAKVKAKSGGGKVVAMPKKKRTMSAAARKKIAAAQRTRWAKVRAANKSA